jgi:DNA-binding LacI/PurR family transcriptional regulator
MAPTGSPSPFVDALIGSGFPLVCIDRASPGAPCDCVLVDNVEGARVAGLDALLYTDIVALRGALRERGFDLSGDQHAS